MDEKKNKLEKFTEWAQREIEISQTLNKDLERPLEVVSDLIDSLTYAANQDGVDLEVYRDILVKLLYHKVLTPIEDDIEVWEPISKEEKESNIIEIYQCSRYPSLYKRVKKDERFAAYDYTDKNRYVCVDINNPGTIWQGGIGEMMLDDYCPIILPYEPSIEPIRIYMENLLYHKNENSKDNEFDTFAVLYFKYPDGSMQEVKRYFKISDNKTVEINKQEYFARRKKCEERRIKDEE